MNKFKSIMADGHTQNKSYLHKLYTDKQVYCSSVRSSEQPIEDEKIFFYREVAFQFCGTGFRTPEQTVLFVWVPKGIFIPGDSAGICMTVYEDWLLRVLSAPVNALSEGLQNDHKDNREKPKFSMQTVKSVVQRRNGCLYVEEREAFRLRINFQFPLVNGHSINGKSGYKGMKMLLDCICDCLMQMDGAALQEHVGTYAKQLEIRSFLKKNDLLAFVADGSILPRQGDTEEPLTEAVPFRSPSGLQVTIPLSDGSVLTGMGIKRGITIITGGGYSGKSTLLDSLEQGIYHHVKGDGREYVIVDETACKIYAEDGRYISPMDISPFFTHLPGKGSVYNFSTPHASGSVSQAANIIEAVYGGSKCLLIDEDTSATNFMIRDEAMRQLVKKEPIIPYTDRILELKEMGISTVLVIGGSGEYLKYGDCILLLEDYVVFDKTDEVVNSLVASVHKAETHTWMKEKYLPNRRKNAAFFYSESVQIENARYIRIDEFVADITRLTALIGDNQINSLTWLLEKLLMEELENVDLNERCRKAADGLLSDSLNTVLAAGSHKYELWLEQVRGLDLLMTVCRLRENKIS